MLQTIFIWTFDLQYNVLENNSTIQILGETKSIQHRQMSILFFIRSHLVPHKLPEFSQIVQIVTTGSSRRFDLLNHSYHVSLAQEERTERWSHVEIHLHL